MKTVPYSNSYWLTYFYFSNGSECNRNIESKESFDKSLSNTDSDNYLLFSNIRKESILKANLYIQDLESKLKQLEQIGKVEGILWIAHSHHKHSPYFLLDTGEIYYDTRGCLGYWTGTFRFGLLNMTKISHGVIYHNSGYVKDNIKLEILFNMSEQEWLYKSNKKQKIHLICTNEFILNKDKYWFQKCDSLQEVLTEVGNYYGAFETS